MPQSLELPELTTPVGFLLRPWRLDALDLNLVREAGRDPYVPQITSVPPVWSEAEGVSFIERQWAKAAAGKGNPW